MVLRCFCDCDLDPSVGRRLEVCTKSPLPLGSAVRHCGAACLFLVQDGKRRVGLVAIAGCSSRLACAAGVVAHRDDRRHAVREAPGRALFALRARVYEARGEPTAGHYAVPKSREPRASRRFPRTVCGWSTIKGDRSAGATWRFLVDRVSARYRARLRGVGGAPKVAEAV